MRVRLLPSALLLLLLPIGTILASLPRFKDTGTAAPSLATPSVRDDVAAVAERAARPPEPTRFEPQRRAVPGEAPSRIALALIDEEGSPIEGASAVVHAGEDVRRARSAADGGVRVAVPSGVPLSVRLGGDAWAQIDTPYAFLEPGEQRHLGRIRLAPAHVVVGVVVDADGGPLAGVDVRACPNGSLMEVLLGPRPAKPTAALRAERTDSAGRFVLRGLPAGSYRVVARTPERPDAEASVIVPGAGANTLRLRMEEIGDAGETGAPVLVAGTVSHGRGDPVRGATVRLRDRENGSSEPLVATTDEEGRFSLGVPTSGAYELEARAWAGVCRRTVLAAYGAPTLDVHLDGRPSFCVRVLDAAGDPIVAADVVVLTSPTVERPEVAIARGRAGDDGRATFFGLDRGELKIRVRPARHAPLDCTVDWDGTWREFDFRTSPPGRARLSVVDSFGRPVPDCEVGLRGVRGEERHAPPRRRTDPTGIAGWESLPAGRYEAFAWPRGSADIGGSVAPLVVVEDELATARLRLRRPVLRVRVTGASGRADGVGGASVGYAPAWDPGALLRATLVGGRSRRTDRAGEASLVLPGAGEFTVFARSNVLGAVSARTLSVTAATRELEIVLGSGVVSGRLVSSDGSPVRRARVVLRPQDCRASMTGRRPGTSDRPFVVRLGDVRRETDDAGGFSFTELEPDTYELIVEHEEHATPRARAIELARGHRFELGTLVLSPRCTLRGTVTGLPSGGGVASVHHDGALVATRELGDDGGFAVEGLPPGRYRISARAASGESAERVVDLRPTDAVHDLALSAASPTRPLRASEPATLHVPPVPFGPAGSDAEFRNPSQKEDS